MHSDEVFEAKIVCGPTTASSARVGRGLLLEVLDDRLDDEVAVLQVGELRRAGQVRRASCRAARP